MSEETAEVLDTNRRFWMETEIASWEDIEESLDLEDQADDAHSDRIIDALGGDNANEPSVKQVRITGLTELEREYLIEIAKDIGIHNYTIGELPI